MTNKQLDQNLQTAIRAQAAGDTSKERTTEIAELKAAKREAMNTIMKRREGYEPKIANERRAAVKEMTTKEKLDAKEERDTAARKNITAASRIA